MCKKNVCLVAALVICTGVGLAAALVLVLRHEPHFYRGCAVPAGPSRKDLSTHFVKNAAQLFNDAKSRDGKWRHSFTEAQINSFFEEDFVRLGEADNLQKYGVESPRILFEENKVRLAFRYNFGLLSTVVSYDLRLWLVPREPNTIAVQILNRRLGALPLSSQALLSELVEVARRHGINVETTLYRHEGHPVAILRFQGDGPRPTTSLHCLKVSPASLTIAGGSVEAEPMPEVKGLAPSAH